jgi:hypothetical protein
VIVDLTAATARLNATFETDSQASTDWVSGIAGTTLDYRVDASYVGVTLAAPPATVQTVQTASHDEAIFLSWVDFFLGRSGGSFGTSLAGSFTTGVRYLIRRNATVIGARFAWAGAAATIRVSLWQFGGAGTRLTFENFAIPGAGIHTVMFSTPWVVPAAYVGSSILVAIWNTSGATYTLYEAAVGLGDALTTTHLTVGRSVTIQENPIRFSAGDTNPSGQAVNEFYAIEPVLL